MDAIYNLPFTRLPHPKYKSKGTIPAYEMIRHSITLHRGCFGGCSFCTISAHQGKFIASRSEQSVLEEARKITQMNDFKGYISDLGGPSANMYKIKGINLKLCSNCKRPSCIYPAICKNLDTNHQPLTRLYQSIDQMPQITKAFIGSGIRYDLLLNSDASEEEQKNHHRYIQQLITRHVSGRLKVAPEHTSAKVLKIMRKPAFSVFRKFNQLFNEINHTEGINQQLIPYFISSHPGSTDSEMAQLAAETKQLNFTLEQVQDFTPTPMTLATVIYYSGYHPYTLKPVYTARTPEEKQHQKMFFFWHQPDMRKKIIQRLKNLGLTKLEKQLFNFKMKSPGEPPTVGNIPKTNFLQNFKRQKKKPPKNKNRRV